MQCQSDSLRSGLLILHQILTTTQHDNEIHGTSQENERFDHKNVCFDHGNERVVNPLIPGSELKDLL